MKLKIVIRAGGCGWTSERRTILGVLVGKKFSLGNVMICRENNKNYRQDFWGKHLESQGNLKRMHCGSVSQLITS